jgi:multiple sugar transport system permease protein
MVSVIATRCYHENRKSVTVNRQLLAAKTAPVAIAEFIGRYAVNINGMMAGGILAAVPPVVLALIFQRYIVSGLTAGAVKG